MPNHDMATEHQVRRCGCSICTASAPAGKNFVLWYKVDPTFWVSEYGERTPA